MPVDEFLGAETVSEFNKWIVRAGLESPGLVLTGVEGFSDGIEREFFVSADLAEAQSESSVRVIEG